MREQLTESRDGVMTRSHRRENRSLDQRIDPEDRHFVPRTGGFSGASPEIRDLSCIVQPLAAGPNQPTALRKREITALCDSATTGPRPPNSIIAQAADTPRHKSAFPRRDAPELYENFCPRKSELLCWNRPVICRAQG
jgi:hypothetical protein